MNDHQAQIALQAPSLLKAAGIPYAAVIVPLASPLYRRDAGQPLFGRPVCGGKQREYHSGESSRLHETSLPGRPVLLRRGLAALVERVRELRQELETPLVLMPGQYEENLYCGRKNLA